MTTTSTREQRDHELAAWAQRGEFSLGSEVPRAEAQARSRALLEAAGVDVDALNERVTRGRPTLAETSASGESPIWRVRASQRLDHQLRQQAKTEGRTLSEVLRDAATEYLAQHAAA